MEDIKQKITGIVLKYLETDNIDTTTNLYGITSARNIIYILLDLSKNYGLEISDEMLKKLKVFSIDNLCLVLNQ